MSRKTCGVIGATAASGLSLGILIAIVLALVVSMARAEQVPVRFGGAFSSLDARRQALLQNWVARFVKTTGQSIEAGPFYDDLLTVSTKTTFDAVTHALMTTQLTDRSGAALGDALSLVEEVDSVRGEVPGAPSDRQFRLYVRLVEGAVDRLEQSKPFERGADNSIYHRGFPISFRAQGGTPSIQISIALDNRTADVDVDYRSSSFPAGLFNGHLTSSNSDVRAGANYDRHVNRWSGFQSWWRGFFGVRGERAPDGETPKPGAFALPRVPRAGKAKVDVMVNDFLQAWLVEGDITAAMGYVSERSYACLARDSDDPWTFDRGLAPFQLMINLKGAHDALPPGRALDGLIVGMRLATPALRVATQPHHAQFVLYSVPDDIAEWFDCESQLALGDPGRVRRVYGKYYGTTFYIAGRRDTPVALLWARENGYWKMVSWKLGMDDVTTPASGPVADPAVVRIGAEPAFVQASRGFLESWLIRKNIDRAFAYLSPKSYECYNVERGPDQPPATSPEDAGRRIRANLEEAAKSVGTPRSLEAILSAADPIHPATRVMNHPLARTFSLSSIPNALADVSECAARAGGVRVPDPMPLEYGNGFGMTVRFKTLSGDAPVLRLLWRREAGAWRITSYNVELP